MMRLNPPEPNSTIRACASDRSIADHLILALVLVSLATIGMGSAVLFAVMRHEEQLETQQEIQLLARDIANRESHRILDARTYHHDVAPAAPNERKYTGMRRGLKVAFDLDHAGGSRRTASGVEEYVTTEKIHGTQWSVVMTYPQQLVDAQALKTAGIALLLGFCMLACQLIGTLLVVRRFAERPLQRLMTKIRPARSDSKELALARIFATQNTSEIAEIGSLFDNMSDAMRLLSANELKFRKMAEYNADAMLHIAANGICLYASPAVFDMTWHAPAALIGRQLSELIHADDIAKVRSEHQLVLQRVKKTAVFEYRALRYDGRWQWLETHTRLMKTDSGQNAVLSVVRDVSHRKLVEDRLTKDARTDALTGLANRAQLLESLHAQIRLAGMTKTPLSLAMLDVDHFKKINDSHGHAAGDDVLRIISARCEKRLRSPQICGRFGGEEFIVLLPQTALADAEKVCERLRASIEDEAIKAGTTIVRATVSMGLAQWRQGETLEQFMARADASLYAAKHNGRNQIRLAA
jgi:diguanylate cyclase (GGDEF)-like protein/PAS domain S-box-containing protein